MDSTTLSLVDSFYLPYIPFYSIELLANLASPLLSNGCEDDLDVISVNYEHPIITYHYSIPITKLAYPEPFIASASLMHSDLWFIHILIYQYWLWFVFVYLIIFFFVTFVSTVRWCNMRVQPRRETRGVSRSKCGDLITACVPVSWATSIIVHESTDAIDYYDGFGTSEMVVGIRAYQWGWEYYYPKDLDLNYTQRPSYSSFIGNSLRYESASSLKTERGSHWKHLLVHLNQRVSNAPSLLWLHGDRFNLLPILAPQTPLWTPLRNTAAFAQARYFSKFTPYGVFSPAYPSPSYITSHLAQRLSSLSYDSSGIVSSLPPFNLLSNSSLRHSTRRGEDYVALLRAKANWSALKLKHPIPSFPKLTSSSLTSNLIPPHSLYLPLQVLPLISPTFRGFSDATTLLSTERIGRIILNFGEGTKLWNQVVVDWKSSPFRNPYTSFVPSLLNQTRFFQRNSAPLPSTAPLNLPSLHDEENELNPSGTPLVLLNKEELLPDWSIVDYNANSQINTSPLWHFYLLNSRINLSHLSSLPPFIPYNEYDFLNWQAYDLWESAFWDFNSGNTFFEESVLNLDTFFDYYIKFRNTRPYTWLARNHRTKKIPYSYVGGESTTTIPYTPSPYLSLTINPNLLDSVPSSSFNLALDVLNSESSYDTLKALCGGWNVSPHFPLLVTGATRQHRLLLEAAVSFSNNYYPLSLWTAPKLPLSPLTPPTPPFIITSLFANLQFPYNPSIRFDQSPSFRLPLKNINVTAQAMQKVFKTRFDELRSFTRPNDFSLVENPVPLISTSMLSLRSSMSKNATIFNKIPLYRYSVSSLLPSTTPLMLNTPAYELPIMLGLKSDPGRHIWIDWFAKWGFYEVQPSSTARYAIYGMPYFAKLFDYTTTFNEEYNETENYFIRLARARRHFQPNWITSPFAFRNNTMLFSMDENFDSIEGGILLDEWEDTLIAYENFFSSQLINGTAETFVNAASSSTTYSRSAWQPLNHKELYNSYAVKLMDILSRREYLYRLLLLKRESHVILPPELVASPYNPVVELWEQNFKLPSVLTDLAHKTPLYVPSFILKYLTPSHSSHLEHWGNMKNQYRPMRKGVNNLLRLHATNAIALPTEIRLQILASSKDVIHSWAVPSAGIKIDCVPGYSSHKIMMFLLSGIFWGQCMEVCGRYHHWMPIVVYFMKRDMFVLWCTHFVFYDKNTQTLRNLSHAPVIHPRPVSYPIESWRDEL